MTRTIPTPLSAYAVLPWERVQGPPADAGICLSGGGIRAASFSMGVLQVLQEERQLISGPASARCLAAVSGGSYIAASFLLGAYHRSLAPADYETMPPLSEGSPEEAHILSSGNYLKGAWPAFAGLTCANILAFVMLFVWTGTLLADAALLLSLIASEWPNLTWLTKLGSRIHQLPIAALAGLVLLAWFLGLRYLYADGFRRLVSFTAYIVLVLTLQPVLEAAAKHPQRWGGDHIILASSGLLAALGMATWLSWLARRKGIMGLPAVVLNYASISLPRLLGLLLLTWTALNCYAIFTPALESADAGTTAKGLILLAVGFIGGFLFSLVPHRASLHRTYRNRLMSCFSVRRQANAAVGAGDLPLSKLAPPINSPHGFPRLLVCTTANVRHAGQSYLPFVLSHDVCGVPGLPNAAFPTAKLELIREPARFFMGEKEPLLSLFTAVATTGAAVSPSMGRYTLPSMRGILAAVNFRLGRWFPNPFKASVRDAVFAMTAPGTPCKRWVLGPGYDELVPEMLSLDAPRIYLSDGGHYDNLGLLAVLAAKCAEIWCIDASPDTGGQADELARVLAIARDKLAITADIDLGRFVVSNGGFYEATHVVGRLTYADGSVARLVVIKLGVSLDSPQELRQRARTDPGFPHHATRHQLYGFSRMDAYRRLGRDSALRCLATSDDRFGGFS